MSEWIALEQASSETGFNQRTLRALAICKFIPAKFEHNQIYVHSPTLFQFIKKANEFVKAVAGIISQPRIHDHDAIRLALKEFAAKRGYKPFNDAVVELDLQPASLRKLIQEGKAKVIRIGRSVLVKVDDELRMNAAQVKMKVQQFAEALEELLANE